MPEQELVFNAKPLFFPVLCVQVVFRFLLEAVFSEDAAKVLH